MERGRFRVCIVYYVLFFWKKRDFTIFFVGYDEEVEVEVDGVLVSVFFFVGVGVGKK